MREAKRASQRFVSPATAFCSWMTSGAPVSQAAMPPGPDDETAAAEHDAGPAALERGARLADRARERERRPEPARDALAAQALDLDPFDRVAGGGHEPRLDAALRAEPDDLAPPAQRARDRERREHMPASAARHDHDRSRHGWRASDGSALLPDAATS